MRQYPKPMPTVINPHKHIMENRMREIKNVNHLVRSERLSNGKTRLWVKGSSVDLSKEEVVAVANHLLNLSVDEEADEIALSPQEEDCKQDDQDGESDKEDIVS